MVDTEAEFRRKDSEYFALLGRVVVHREQVAQIIAYQPLRGPEYLFTLQYPDVLPTQFEIAARLHGEKHGDGCTFTNPANCDRWHESLREADAVLKLLDGSES
jgi:hypothetical protein